MLCSVELSMKKSFITIGPGEHKCMKKIFDLYKDAIGSCDVGQYALGAQVP